MAVEDFEGGALSVEIDATNSSYGGRNGPGSAVFDSKLLVSGQSGHFTGTGQAIALDYFPAGGSLVSVQKRRYYLTLNAAPGDHIFFEASEQGVGAKADWRIRGDNHHFEIRNNFVSEAESTAVCPTDGSLVRVEWSLDLGAGTQQFGIFTTNPLTQETADETLFGIFDGGQFNRMRDGATISVPTLDMHLDAVSDFLGPAVVNEDELYARVGGAYQAAKRYRFAGGVWS